MIPFQIVSESRRADSRDNEVLHRLLALNRERSSS